MTILDWLHLKFHGYCTKHLARKSFSQTTLSSYCDQCRDARYKRGEERNRKADLKAEEIIRKLAIKEEV